MPARVLVCGAGGLLGRALLAAAQTVPAVDVTGRARAELDVTDPAAVRSALTAVRPQVVINAAAYTDVDGAEREPAKANLGNVRTAAVLASETAWFGCSLLHVSTDHVFAGTLRRPYRPDDATGPLNAYGRSKLAGEEWIRRLQPRAWIVRTSGLFGPGGRNFVAAIARRAMAGEPLAVVDDQVCGRTYSADLAAGLLKLAAGGAPYGTYHVTNGGAEQSWYEFARQVVELLKVQCELDPVSSEEYGAAARRPAYSVLDRTAWTAAGLPELRPVDSALAEYLSRLDSGLTGT